MIKIGTHDSSIAVISNLVFSLVLIFLQIHIAFSSNDIKVKPLTINDIRRDDNKDGRLDLLGKYITVAGRANINSERLRAKPVSLFIQNDSAGLALNCQEVTNPIFEGDSVIVTGCLEFTDGLMRVNDSKYQVVLTRRRSPQPLDISVKEVINDTYRGILVRLRGFMMAKRVETHGTYLTIKEYKTDRDSLNVFISNRYKSGVEFNGLNIGNAIVLTGVLGRHIYNSSFPLYEVYLRYPEDLHVMENETEYYQWAMYTWVLFIILSSIWIIALRMQGIRRTRELHESEERFRSIYDGTKDAILLLRDDWQILDVNPAACDLCNVSRGDLISKSLWSIIKQENLPEFTMKKSVDTTAVEFETSLIRTHSEEKLLDVKMSVIHSVDKRRFIVVLRDITERKKAEQEREELIRELTAALAEVRTLTGLLPICSSCKKIRDDQGYWNQIEEYFHKRSDVQFTHGLCPECMAQLYPDIIAERDKSDKPT
jgi:PAS domain S-box-containing protein